jgi:phosphate transport system substrate-binding protein
VIPIPSAFSFGYLDNNIKAVTIGGVAPNAENAKNGTYPIIRPFLFLTRGEPTGIVKAVLDYCTGPEAQEFVTDEGYISVN